MFYFALISPVAAERVRGVAGGEEFPVTTKASDK